MKEAAAVELPREVNRSVPQHDRARSMWMPRFAPEGAKSSVRRLLAGIRNGRVLKLARRPGSRLAAIEVAEVRLLLHAVAPLGPRIPERATQAPPRRA